MRNDVITFLRSYAIIAIVVHHALCAFCGWPPNHVINIDLPDYALFLCDLLKNFGLGIFTFISGYLLYYQRNKQECPRQFVAKKTKRILYPCFFYAFVYYFFFDSFMYDTWPAPINGTHLWYLPMLYICSLVTSIDLFKQKYGYAAIFITLILCAVLYLCLSLRTLLEVVYFLPVFFLGYIIHKYNVERFILSQELFITSIIGGGILAIVVSACNFPLVGNEIRLAVYSLLAFFLALALLKKHKISKLERIISTNSFPIYLIHQFVINTLLVLVPFSSLGFYVSFTILVVMALFLPICINCMYTNIKLTIQK